MTDILFEVPATEYSMECTMWIPHSSVVSDFRYQRASSTSITAYHEIGIKLQSSRMLHMHWSSRHIRSIGNPVTGLIFPVTASFRRDCWFICFVRTKKEIPTLYELNQLCRRQSIAELTEKLIALNNSRVFGYISLVSPLHSALFQLTRNRAVAVRIWKGRMEFCMWKHRIA